VQIPQTLAEQLRRGRVVPFVGAGVSMAVRGADGKGLFPSWGELLRRGGGSARGLVSAQETTVADRHSAEGRCEGAWQKSKTIAAQ
jgi:hypothetical protein